MTAKEKSSRYDALQVAIKLALESYRKRAKDSERKYYEAKAIGLIEAYSRGQSDAFYFAAGDLERWIDNG